MLHFLFEILKTNIYLTILFVGGGLKKLIPFVFLKESKYIQQPLYYAYIIVNMILYYWD